MHFSVRRHAGGGDEDVHSQAAGWALSTGRWCGVAVTDSGWWDQPPPFLSFFTPKLSNQSDFGIQYVCL